MFRRFLGPGVLTLAVLFALTNPESAAQAVRWAATSAADFLTVLLGGGK